MPSTRRAKNVDKATHGDDEQTCQNAALVAKEVERNDTESENQKNLLAARNSQLASQMIESIEVESRDVDHCREVNSMLAVTVRSRASSNTKCLQKNNR